MHGRFPLSPLQIGMLIDSAVSEEAGFYVQQQLCWLSHSVEKERLRCAWEATAERHASLRTVIRWKRDADGYQEVKNAVDIGWKELDWSSRQSPINADVELFLREDRGRAFDFDAGACPSRLSLIRFHESEYLLIWTYHHALLDGQTRLSILRDVFSHYDANHLVSSNEPVTQHGEQHQLSEHGEHSETLRFWEQQLEGFVAPTTPAPSSRVVGSIDIGCCTGELDESTTNALILLAEESSGTLTTIVQAAWAMLLGRYTDSDDVVFGATRRVGLTVAGGSHSGFGVNTLPMRAHLDWDRDVSWLLRQLREQWVNSRPHTKASMMDVLAISEVPPGAPLYESSVVFERASTNSTLACDNGPWDDRNFELRQRTSVPLDVCFCGEASLTVKIRYHRHRYDGAYIKRMLGHLITLLRGIALGGEQRLGSLSLLDEAEAAMLLGFGEGPRVDIGQQTIPGLFEKQVSATPSAVAVVCGGEELSYQELNAAANQVAHYLKSLALDRGVPIGVCMPRGIDCVIAVLGILKAGAAYVPLDPTYPAERIAFATADSGTKCVLTTASLRKKLPKTIDNVMAFDADWDQLAEFPTEDVSIRLHERDLAYVTYTSGSTGRPKGVMAEHRSVVNFFVGIDRILGDEEPGVWLAMTSLAFDISVVELLWTLCRGFKVVIARTDLQLVSEVGRAPQGAKRPIDFSLFYFAGRDMQDGDEDKYRLMLEGARFADRNGFAAVWTPERHFHSFGGLYPNPAVTGAAIAAVTERVGIRAGSCVLPLHNPLRVAEEWAVVDNLSRGRTGLAFATGWHPNDFVLAPDSFEGRKAKFLEQIESFRALWRGDTVSVRGVRGVPVEVSTLPRPVQTQPPLWITAAGNPTTFEMAGSAGCRVLTHLLGQSNGELRDKLDAYHRAWRDAGNQGQGYVTLMLHTFVGSEEESVRKTVREPLKEYLKTAVGLLQVDQGLVSRLQRQDIDRRKSPMQLFEGGELSAEELETVLDHAVERYYGTSGLFGTPSSCLDRVEEFRELGVDEVACLIDFGIQVDTVLNNLEHLNELRQATRPHDPGQRSHVEPDSLAELIERHGVTHVQCTPSTAMSMLDDEQSASALRDVRHFLLGGEELPPNLARELRQHCDGEVVNLYGPTETTVYSTYWKVVDDTVLIGTPVVNTQVRLLNRELQPVPIGACGEIYIGGVGVTRGYFKREQLTAERYVELDGGGEDASIFYRTGDLARFHEDGNIEFLGRIDDQVKIRGHRIELGEIESVLEEHASVKQAVVRVRDLEAHDRRLVAYCQPADGSPIDHQILIGFVSSKLPEPMVPTEFRWVESFPLTPNGKLDRRALDQINENALTEGTPSPSPPTTESLTELQCRVANLWQDVLQASAVGLDDNFFALGGHSLLAVKLHRRIVQEMELPMKLADLFRHVTLRALCEHLETLPDSPAKLAE